MTPREIEEERMKRSALGVLAAAIVLATSACSTTAPSPQRYIDQANSAAAQADQANQKIAEATQDGNPSSGICAQSATPEMQALAIGVQLLAQPNLDVIKGLRKAGSVGPRFDIDKMNQGIKEYRVLDGHPAPGAKDPKVVLDKWQDLTDRMAKMIDGPNDPTQADVDAYKKAMGSTQDLIMSQGDVNRARDQYCKK